MSASEAGRMTVTAILVGLMLYGYYRLVLAALRKENEMAEAEERRRYHLSILNHYREQTAKRNAVIANVQQEPEFQDEQAGGRQADGEAA